MIKHLAFLLCLTLLIVVNDDCVFAQNRKGAAITSITGFVVDESDQKPISYAYVILYNVVDSAQVNGGVTENDGFFQLVNIPPGNYYLKVDYMGYESETIENLEIKNEKSKIELNTIELKGAVLTSEAIEVTAEKAPMVYKIDKKVINVSQQLTAISGTAVDVLENVPSITVDIEGNVELRGSASFVVLLVLSYL